MVSDVTVLIPFYNREDYLPAALKSVFYQTYSEWELILIDDGSTDNSVDVIQDFLKDPRVTLVKNDTNFGKTKSLNEGLKLVKTPFVIELDSDDLFYSDTLDVLLTEAKKQPEDVGIVCGNIKLFYENSQGKRIRSKVKKGHPFKDRYDFLLRNLNVWPRFYRTSALKEIGGWPTDDPYGGRHGVDDLRVILRLLEKYKFHWINKTLYKSRQHSNNISNQKEMVAEVVKWSICNALERWGNKYKPIFKTVDGWIVVDRLEPTNKIGTNNKNKDSSEVTVLIPSYNPGAYIVEALNSIYHQSYRNWKIIIVDDASTDNSIELIQGYLEDPRITLIKNVKNLGQSKCLNLGLSLVETPYIVQLDADDWFFPHTLERLVKEASNQPDNVGVLCGNMRIVWENKNGKCQKTQVRKGRSFQDKYDFMLSNSSIHPRFYRTELLKEIGGWPTGDPYGGRHAEDIRLLSRLIENYNFHWIDDVLLNHRRHGKNSSNQQKVYADIMEWIVCDNLKRWGNEYEPVFEDVEGWRIVKKLIPNSNK
jgi:glycosyltransferase involved in cell wall biosynthesis